MASDNGKAGVVDMLDVWEAMSYVENHYDGSMQLLMERAAHPGFPELLCSLTFIPNDGTKVAGACILLEVAATQPNLRRLPELLHREVYRLQENLDAALPGQIVLGFVS